MAIIGSVRRTHGNNEQYMWKDGEFQKIYANYNKEPNGSPRNGIMMTKMKDSSIGLQAQRMYHT